MNDQNLKEHTASRRQFLGRTTLGAAGLLLSGGAWRALAANDASTNAMVASGNSKPAFQPVRYRPLPVKVRGLHKNVVLLDGQWHIDPTSGNNTSDQSLTDSRWRPFQVPGQWVLQGYDIPKEKSAVVAAEFIIPKEWADFRVFIRFDAIHAGTNYHLNGQALGYSENLFTPVEWEITSVAKFGQSNRLDLDMKVATASERLSTASGYTGYSLGGIDRSVRIYALPKLHVSQLHLNAGLDKEYRDGELKLTLGIDNPAAESESDYAVAIHLFDAHGHRVSHSNPRATLDPLSQGLTTVDIASQVDHPLKWNAEQPNLYKLVIALEKDGHVVEEIEQQIGFRSVEIRGRQLYVNGVRVKLAGVCHHEIDPLTGRANTMRHAEEDVKWFKQANINLVRTSHYPATREFLEAADQYGLYIESEAPFCWVGGQAKDLPDLQPVLTATSAMIDRNHGHPSIILWSLANESHWSGLFTHSNKLVKKLDPTRPTVLEHVFTREKEVTCDVMSRHYQDMPYDLVLKDDKRPFLHGECFFLVYHERTDVAINPGLRELWAAGNANPNSAWGRAIIENIHGKTLQPGVYPGAWSYIYHSNQCIGSEIWSGVDDIAYLPNGKVASSENGNAWWGIIDGWRRPKPELWLSKFVYSPVWFPTRTLDCPVDAKTIRVPVENRYSFTNLSELEFAWQLNGSKGKSHADIAPGATGELEIPVHAPIPAGAILLIRALKNGVEVVNATLALGERAETIFPKPAAGAPTWSDDGKTITIEGRGFALVLDRASGEFDAQNPKHHAPLITFPSLHVATRDFGDLDHKKPARMELPDAKTRTIQSVTASKVGNALEIVIKDASKNFTGSLLWLLDKTGEGWISYDYIYTGDDLDAREIGVKASLTPEYDKVQWRRWSEWGLFPEDSISRTEGTAMAHRDKKWPVQPVNIKPSWPWSQDQTELGTADFRSIKFCIYEASLAASNGSGVRVNANGEVHFRVCLAEHGVQMHLLTQCTLLETVVKKGTRLTGGFALQLLPQGSV